MSGTSSQPTAWLWGNKKGFGMGWVGPSRWFLSNPPAQQGVRASLILGLAINTVLLFREECSEPQIWFPPYFLSRVYVCDVFFPVGLVLATQTWGLCAPGMSNLCALNNCICKSLHLRIFQLGLWIFVVCRAPVPSHHLVFLDVQSRTCREHFFLELSLWKWLCRWCISCLEVFDSILALPLITFLSWRFAIVLELALTLFSTPCSTFYFWWIGICYF